MPARLLKAMPDALRLLLTGAAAEAIHDAGMCDNLARLVEMIDRDPALLDRAWADLSPTEVAVWARVRELMAA